MIIRLTPFLFMSSLQRALRHRPLHSMAQPLGILLHRCPPIQPDRGHSSIFALPMHAANKREANFYSSSTSRKTHAPVGNEPIVFETRSQLQLERLGAGVAKIARRGDVFLLRGVVGAGKTCFARGFIRGITGDPTLAVTSPTYLLDNVYTSREGISVHHMDLYRLKEGADLRILGIPDIFKSCISLIEWPERFAFPLQGKHYEVEIEVVPLELSLRSREAGDPKDAGAEKKERFGRRTRILPVVGDSGDNSDLTLLTSGIRKTGLWALNKNMSYRRVILGRDKEFEVS